MQNDHYKLLKLLDENPGLSQRELAREMGTSLGKVNYCLKALLDKGHIKVQSFRNNRNKAGYLYLLTPRGVKQKSRLAARFLKRKVAEYEALREEIDELKRELE